MVACQTVTRDAGVYRVEADASLRQDRQSMPWLLGWHLAGLDANTGLCLLSPACPATGLEVVAAPLKQV